MGDLASVAQSSGRAAKSQLDGERPVRVQLSRVRGWRLPAGAVKVDRSTRWGNPWPVGEYGPLDRKPIDAVGAVGFFRQMFSDPEMRQAADYPDNLSALRGKTLACWCKLGDPCHADVLLELANAPLPEPSRDQPAAGESSRDTQKDGASHV